MSIFTYQNHDIFYEINGDLSSNKPVMVILNGIMMSTKSWDAFIPAWSQNNTVIRYDMVDQGQSSKVDFNYTQEIQVDLLYQLLKYLQLETVNVIGISYGASVALQFAIAHPGVVEHLVIANAVAKTSPWLHAIGDGWNEVAKTRDGLAYYNITIPYIYSPQFYTKEIAWMNNRKNLLIPIFSNPVFLDAMTRLTKSAETHDTTEHLHTITAHTLIIAGEMDFLTPVFEQEFIHQRIPASQLVVLPGCGHASMYEQPDLFTTLLLGFINHTDKPRIL